MLLGESGKVDIGRSLEEASETFDEIGDILNERQVALKEAMERASHFEEEIESVLNWLPKLEETLENMGPIALDIRSIKIQIEEVKILKLQAVGECLSSVSPSLCLSLPPHLHPSSFLSLRLSILHAVPICKQALHLSRYLLLSGKCVAIEGINSSVQALKNKSPVAAENFVAAVGDINNRWNKLVDGIFDREVSG